MLTWLVSTSLRLLVVVLALALLLLIVGIREVQRTPLDVFPLFAPPYGEIPTEAPLSSLSRVLKIGVSPKQGAAKKLSQRDMTTLALWTIRPRLMSVPGVANVSIWGQRDRQLQVLVHPDRLQANGVTLDAVTKAA